jgi:superfamily II DNA or RNA helicase
MTSAAASFDARVLLAAQRLLDSGQIADVRVLQNGRVVTGIVSPEAHRVFIRYAQAAGAAAPTLQGECSCGERSPCPHVAAVAMWAAGKATASTAGAHPFERRRTESESVRVQSVARQGLCYRLEDLGGACQVSVWVALITAGSREIAAGAHAYARRAAAGGDEHPRYVEDADRSILDALPRPQGGRWPLQGDTGFELVRRIVATGRALWQSSDGKTLRWGAPRQVPLEWRAAANGEQWLTAGSETCGSTPLHLIVSVAPALYIDVDTHECGASQFPYAVGLLRRYWGRAALRPEDVAAVNDWLAERPEAAAFPRPRAIRVLREPLSTLSGSLTLSAGPEARLGFLYNGYAIPSHELGDGERTVRHLDDDLHEIDRDVDTERRLRSELNAIMPEAPRTQDAWLEFLLEAVPRLCESGWKVTIDASFPYRLAAADEWYADLATHSRPEWFDLKLGVVVDGQPVNLLPALVDHLHATSVAGAAPSLLGVAHRFVRLDDGRYVPVPTARLQRIAETLVELFDRDALNDRQALSLPRNQAARLVAFTDEPGAPALGSSDPSLRPILEQIGEFARIKPLAAPPECRASLREYQQQGLGWLQFLRRHGLGGILADDMGLGKTVQTLAHLATEKAHGRLEKPVLIVAPVSVLGNWQTEIRRFTPSLTAVTVQGAKRQRLFASLGNFDIIIIGYPSLLFDAEVWLAREFSVVILDEAQTIKNPHARVSQMARALAAEQRLCLTGTPMENHLGDLWSLCEFAQPGLLGTERSFLRQYRTPIEKSGNVPRAEALRRRIAPFLLRRTKDTVARELPPKTEIIESVVMDELQRDLYDGIRLSMHRRVRAAIAAHGVARSHITFLDALVKLRQVCCDPRLLATGESEPAAPSAKLDWLSTALPELIADGRRVLLFSQFTSMLALIESLVNELSIPYCLLTGESQGRAAVIERFQSGEVPLFLLSLKAGGAGLNLTAADTVIHYDPWWNPAVEMQATDRAHRIGQHKPVFVYKLITQGTVEEKIRKLQADKHALLSQLYTAGNASPLLSADDLDALLGP